MQILTNQREIYTEESGATLCLAVTDVPPSRPLAQLLHTSFADPSHSRKLPPPPPVAALGFPLPKGPTQSHAHKHTPVDRFQASEPDTIVFPSGVIETEQTTSVSPCMQFSSSPVMRERSQAWV